jgi:hypothetical protein
VIKHLLETIRPEKLIFAEEVLDVVQEGSGIEDDVCCKQTRRACSTEEIHRGLEHHPRDFSAVRGEVG